MKLEGVWVVLSDGCAKAATGLWSTDKARSAAGIISCGVMDLQRVCASSCFLGVWLKADSRFPQRNRCALY